MSWDCLFDYRTQTNRYVANFPTTGINDDRTLGQYSVRAVYVRIQALSGWLRVQMFVTSLRQGLKSFQKWRSAFDHVLLMLHFVYLRYYRKNIGLKESKSTWTVFLFWWRPTVLLPSPPPHPSSPHHWSQPAQQKAMGQDREASPLSPTRKGDSKKERAMGGGQEGGHTGSSGWWWISQPVASGLVMESRWWGRPRLSTGAQQAANNIRYSLCLPAAFQAACWTNSVGDGSHSSRWCLLCLIWNHETLHACRCRNRLRGSLCSLSLFIQQCINIFSRFLKNYSTCCWSLWRLKWGCLSLQYHSSRNAELCFKDINCEYVYNCPFKWHSPGGVSSQKCLHESD